MPLRLFHLPSYDRCIKKLGRREKQIAGQIVSALYAYFQSGSSQTGTPFVASLEGRHRRLVFKKLRGEIWETYIEGKVRVLTRFEKNAHTLVFAGNHDEVQRFLKDRL